MNLIYSFLVLGLLAESGMAIRLSPQAYSLPVDHPGWEIPLTGPGCIEEVTLTIWTDRVRGQTPASGTLEVADYTRAFTAGDQAHKVRITPRKVASAITLKPLPVAGDNGKLIIEYVDGRISGPDSPVCGGGHHPRPHVPQPVVVRPDYTQLERQYYAQDTRQQWLTRTHRQPVHCGTCQNYGYNRPTYYQSSLMANVSQEAIFLINELRGYTNYRDLGDFVLPIRKAAAHSLAMAERWGDASRTAAQSYEILLQELDNAEAYINENFERDYVFDVAQDLLSLREYIRRILT